MQFSFFFFFFSGELVDWDYMRGLGYVASGEPNYVTTETGGLAHPENGQTKGVLGNGPHFDDKNFICEYV